MSGRARGALERTRLRLPIRLKLAVVSAGLTFAILLLFALVSVILGMIPFLTIRALRE